MELAVVLCGVSAAECITLSNGSPGPVQQYTLLPESANKLWNRLCKEDNSELAVADHVSALCRTMIGSNARMYMLLVECLQRRRSLMATLDMQDANAPAIADSIAREAAMRFKEMHSAFATLTPREMLPLYQQALRTCLWHLDESAPLEHPELLTKFGIITDVRPSCEYRVVFGPFKRRCFTMAPAMTSFFRIMLNDDHNTTSFLHELLHYVSMALRSCAGRSVEDFLSLVVNDPLTIPVSKDNQKTSQQTIPVDINETLLVLSLGSLTFDEESVKSALAAAKREWNISAREKSTKEMLDLAFTYAGDRKNSEANSDVTLTAKRPVVLLNGENANAADIIVIVPGVFTCHFQYKGVDEIDDSITKEYDREPRNDVEKTANAQKITEIFGVVASVYQKMCWKDYLTEPPLQYFVLVTTTTPLHYKRNKFQNGVQKTGLPLLVLRVSRTVVTNSDDRSNCAFFQSLLGIEKVEQASGVIVEDSSRGTS